MKLKTAASHQAETFFISVVPQVAVGLYFFKAAVDFFQDGFHIFIFSVFKFLSADGEWFVGRRGLV